MPVIIRNGTKEIVINALLDDGSTKSYLNSDIAAALGLEGNFQRVTVDVLNGHTEVLETMPVDLILESVDRKLCKPMNAFTEVASFREYKVSEHPAGNSGQAYWGRLPRATSVSARNPESTRCNAIFYTPAIFYTLSLIF